jgi:O-antigen biosynthesis protein
VNVLLTTNHLSLFGGSEINILDLAREFTERGDRVSVGTFSYGHPIDSEFKKSDITVFDLRGGIPNESFDLHWCQHNSTLGRARMTLGFRAGHTVYNCLSPFEPLEKPPTDCRGIDLVMGVSEEVMGKYPQVKYVFPNSVRLAGPSKLIYGCMSKILMVSNHLPTELEWAAKMLNASGFNVRRLGLGAEHRYLIPSDVASYDAVVSIGRTVQYGLVYGVPVYNYDRFGGCGWITKKNMEAALKNNFSGRDCLRRLTAEGVFKEISGGCLLHESVMVEEARSRFDLKKNVEDVLRRIGCAT